MKREKKLNSEFSTTVCRTRREMERLPHERDALQRQEDEEEEISLSDDGQSRHGSRDALVNGSSSEDLEKKRMISEVEQVEGGMDDELLEFGHSMNCYKLFIQSAVAYFYRHRQRFRGVLLASTLVAALLILAVLFISIYDPDAGTTERSGMLTHTPLIFAHVILFFIFYKYIFYFYFQFKSIYLFLYIRFQ
jgi:hypothetical protein